MRDRRAGMTGKSELANLPTLHSFVALFFCQNNCPADCASLCEREKSQYTPRGNAQLLFQYNVSIHECMYIDRSEYEKTSPRYENAKCKNARDDCKIRLEI